MWLKGSCQGKNYWNCEGTHNVPITCVRRTRWMEGGPFPRCCPHVVPRGTSPQSSTTCGFPSASGKGRISISRSLYQRPSRSRTHVSVTSLSNGCMILGDMVR